jgi:hypothetical protein
MHEGYGVADWSWEWCFSYVELAKAMIKAGPMAAAAARLLVREP